MSQVNPSVSPSPRSGGTPWWVWLVIAALASALIGTGSTILSYAGGEAIVPAIKSGGAAFMATMALSIGIIGIFHSRRR